MITLNASGSSVTFTFDGNSTYLNDGTIEVPKNSLALIIDESDMATFRKAASNDIFVSANIAEFGMTKAELESWFKANAVGSTGGDITSGEVQTMIDESISGKADTSYVDQSVSGKANSSDVYTTGQTSGATEIANALSAKLDATAYTPTDLSEYWTSAQTSSAIDEATSGKTNQSDFTAYTASTDAALSGKVNVSDNIVSAHTFNARSYSTYITKLKFDGKHFNFNDFHSKKISVYPFGGMEGQLFTSLYLDSSNNVTYDAAAYLSGSTSDDYPPSFTSVTWTGDETKMKVEINSEGYLDLIAQGDYWFGQIDSNAIHELYVNILNDIASGQSASVINDNIVDNLENLGNTINGIQYEINGKLDVSAYTPINVDSVLSQTSTNPIQNKSLFNELRVSGASSGETTIVFVNQESTNYPEGVTVIKFEPTQSNTWTTYDFYNGSSYLGSIQVSYYGSISVNLSLDGATYATSGNTVILTVPTTLGINKIAQLMGDYNNFTVKVENPPIYTSLKDVVNEKQDILSAGTGISISGNVISAEGGGSKAIKGGIGITVTTGATADTVSLNVPISGGSEPYSIQENGGTALGGYSHAEGINTMTMASSMASHAEGDSTVAGGVASHTEGVHTTATNLAEHASGRYNKSSISSNTFGDSGNTLFTVGNGTSSADTHNAFEIRQNGDIYFEYDGSDVKLQDKLDEIETVTAAALNNLNDRFGGLSLVKLTQTEYDNLQTKDPNVLYVIVG